jgi:hypothetical protein
LPLATTADADGQFDWAGAVSGEVVTFAFGVLLAFVIPWLTVLITKRVERRAGERATRLDAATALLQRAADHLMDVQKAREPGSYTFWPIEMRLAEARVLILTNSGRRRGQEALGLVMATAGREMISSRLAVILGDWVPKGRFPITDPPHRKAAKWSKQQLQRLFRKPEPESAATAE